MRPGVLGSWSESPVRDDDDDDGAVMSSSFATPHGGENAAISVVIPAYKAEAFIARAVTSVLAQPDVRPEIIVVVDGVYDRTAAIAGGFPGVTVLMNDENRGAPAARNRGLAAASAPYVLFLDADDYIEGPFLTGLLATAEEQALDLVFGPACREWPDGRRDFVRPINSKDSIKIMSHWIVDDMVPPCSVVWNRDFLCSVGVWKENLLRLQDVELAWRGMLQARNIGYCTTTGGCGVYVQHDGPRITSQHTAQSLRSILEVYRWVHAELSSRGNLTEPVRWALCTNAYRYMCASYLAGFDVVAEEFALEWRELGGVRHEGTFLHRLACSIIGLRWKQRFSASRLAHRLRTALAMSRSMVRSKPRRESLAQRMRDQRISVAGLFDGR